MSGRTVMLVACMAICAHTIGAQQVRDPASAQAATGTARIVGRVVTADTTPQPMRRVIVTLTAPELPGGRAAVTDADGRFSFDRLPAGRYAIAGSKPAYLDGAYGAHRPGRAGIPVQLAAGESRVDVTFTMFRGAAISGVLRGANGEPAPGIDVAALRLPPLGDPPVLVMSRFGTTDDRGAYRIYGLMPGEYLVSSLMGATTRVSDVSAMSTAQLDDALAALQRRLNSSTAPGAGQSAPAMGTFGVTPVFFPGTPSADAATRITLAAEEDRDGVDFTVRLTRMATIQGAVIDGGNPIKPLIINPSGFDMPSLNGSAPTFTWQATETGRTFQYGNVVPGRYTITAESTAPGVAWARTEVEVAGADLAGVTLVMQPALRFSGRVEFDGTSPRPSNPDAIQIKLASLKGSGTSSVGYTRMGNAFIPPALVEADGRFEMLGVIPDVYRLTATIPASAWWLRSAMVNGVDLLDRLLEVGAAGNIEGAVLMFSDQQTTLSGTIQTADGKPAPAYFIAVFPTDRSLWRPQARRIQSARAGTDGSWMVRGLPAGEYYVAALSDLAAGDLSDIAFLSELVAKSVKLAIAEGVQKTQNLRIGR
jgi:uncharacterized protein (DUF2141 family)